MVAQLHFYYLDPRPICPACKSHADLLGQVYPVRPFAVCRDCMVRLNVSMRVFQVDKDGDIYLGESWDERADVMHVIGALKRLTTGCALTLDDMGDKYHLPCDGRAGCRKCRAEKMYSVRIRESAIRNRHQRNEARPVPMPFPFCDRCGALHGRVYAHNGMPSAYCQRCEDELAVEALYRVIFGEDADVETIMDRLWTFKCEVFERGVLPDYWYTLMTREETRNG